MTATGRPLIACGMYAFTDQLRAAWTGLLRGMPALLDDGRHDASDRADLSFETSDTVYQRPDLLIGHTCGYPYLRKWRETHVPVAVPVFDLPGCRGHEYSSWFVCRAGDQRRQLADFSGAIAAVNHEDSNSGMNVFRHAVQGCAGGRAFFDQVRVSGSHVESLRMIVRAEADIAAIDAVTFHHAKRGDPLLAERVRVVGQSVFTPGLPFIQHRDSPFEPLTVADALNRATESVSNEVRGSLGLLRFQAVADHDYAPLTQLEVSAIRSGYPALA